MSVIEIISHSFPNRVAPYDATFVYDHAKVLSEVYDVHITVPTPYSLPFTNRHKKNQSHVIIPTNTKGERCFYFSLPNKKLPGLINRSLSRNIIRHLREQFADLIHLHFLYPSGMAIPNLKREFNIPVVLTIHGVDFYHTYHEPGLKKILMNALEQVDMIISVGQGLQQDLISEYPHLKSKIHCIYNFVDTGSFKPVNHTKKEQLKLDLNLKPSKFQLLCVANFRHKKGIDTLIDALALIDHKDQPNLHLIGRLNEEPDFQSMVNNKIQASGLTNVFIHGPKPRDEIKKWMQAVDGFVLPSRNEPFGISLIEAMACGLPVISTRSGGPEIILSDKWGSLVDPENPVQLSEAILKMTQPGAFDAEGQCKYIEENFGKERYVKEYTELYDQLLSK